MVILKFEWLTIFVHYLLGNFEIALNQVAKFKFKCQSFICCLNKVFKDKLVTKYKRVIFDKETYKIQLM